MKVEIDNRLIENLKNYEKKEYDNLVGKEIYKIGEMAIIGTKKQGYPENLIEAALNELIRRLKNDKKHK